MNSLYILTFFIFFFFRFTISTFTLCSDPFCDPTLLVLEDIASAFKSTSYLKENWKTSKRYCSWVCIRCDVFRNIIALNFRKMNLMGTISNAFFNLTSLQYLFLDHNNLTGQVPESLTKLTWLLQLDISYNNLSGPVPIFDSLIELDVRGNPLLQISSSIPPKNEENEEGAGNKEQEGEGEGEEARNQEKEHENETGKLALSKLIFILVPVMFAVVVLVFVFFKFYKANRRRKGAQSVQVLMDKSEKVIFSIQLLRQATNNFAKNNILGQGGCGVVYRGNLNDGTKIAIKKMNFQALEARGFNEFQAEIDVLTRVRHRHLVALFAYCVDANERYLVYEYMPEGTLTQHLFDWEENGYVPLTWKQRVIIVLDVARGIEYLHNLAAVSFIHRDLKSSNILLDDELRAKVADFGLVKSAPIGQSLETRLAGTFGYLAPEYGATGKVTTKIDVYAFGAILMEILTGRRALDNSLGDDQSHLVTWFRQNMMKNENIQNLIDQTLDLDEEILESVQCVVELAMHCTTLERHHRPDMNYVVNMLDSLVDEWSPIVQNEEDEYEALEKGHVEEGSSD